VPNPNRIDIPFASCELTVPDGPALYLCAAPGEVWARFASNALAFEQAHFPLHDQLIAQGAMAAAPDDADFALTLLNITKSRDETRAQIADAWRRTRVGGAIVISGDKTEGIERHLRDLKSMIAIDGSAAKAHGKVFWITKTEETPDGFADWTKAGEMSQMAEGFWTAPGMFSEGKVDRGSEALAARFSEKFTGDVADLGAGWGYLSAQLLATCPKITRVDLIEAHAGALAAAKRNVTSDRAQFLWADATHDRHEPALSHRPRREHRSGPRLYHRGLAQPAPTRTALDGRKSASGL